MANNLAYLRYKAGLTQAEVANKIGSCRQTISLIELGKIPLSVRFRIKLAETYGISEDDIKTNVEEIK